MNVRGWTGDPSNSSLKDVMILTGSVSAAVIILALTAAFFHFWSSLIGPKLTIGGMTPKKLNHQREKEYRGRMEERVKPQVDTDETVLPHHQGGTLYEWLWRGLHLISRPQQPVKESTEA
jgi:hypothetical protein